MVILTSRGDFRFVEKTVILVLIGLLGTGRASLGGTIREGQCCDLRNFCDIRLSGTRLSGPILTNVRSGLAPVFQRPE